MTEILAPAGSEAAFAAAIRAGADAVYLGGERFGARAYAANFDEQTLLRTIDTAHLFGKKIYLTVNTLIKEKELPDLYQFLLPYYEAGLDAVIVQDLGAMKLVRDCFPGMHIHASTQMTVTGLHGASFLYRYGADRVIPARELSLEEIRSISDGCPIEIECFVHGALCYSYSGQCLMSSLIGGRSGNRGRCAQPCRQMYTVFDGDRKLSGPSCAYPLNTKDICTVSILPQLLSAGICSFKIEGRMKRPEYTAGVVSVYRKYLDLAESGEPYAVDPADLQFLYNLFNRDGFSESYYRIHNGLSMMALKNEKNGDAAVRRADRNYAYVQEKILSKERKITLDARAGITEEKAILSLSDGTVTSVTESSGVRKAKNHALTEDDFREHILRTGGTDFTIRLESPVIAPDVFMTAKEQNELRRNALEDYTREKLSLFRRNEALPYPVLSALPQGPAENAALSVQVRTEEQLEAALSVPEVQTVILPLSFFGGAQGDGRSLPDAVLSAGKKPAAALAYVSRRPERPEYAGRIAAACETGADLLVSSIEDLAFLLEKGWAGHVILDAGFYMMNPLSRAFVRQYGILRDTVPYELNRQEIKARDNTGSELVVYGRIPLMVSVQCVRKNYGRCTRKNEILYLQDRKKYNFPILCDCGNCQNVIWNAVPISLLSRKKDVRSLGISGVRLVFTTEEREETAARIRGWIRPDECVEDFAFTRGHFNRGVE